MIQTAPTIRQRARNPYLANSSKAHFTTAATARPKIAITIRIATALLLFGNDLGARHFVEHYKLSPRCGELWSCFRESTRDRSARPKTSHNKVSSATVMIHKSNLARSIANSMNAARRIVRDAIRVILVLRQPVSWFRRFWSGAARI